MCEITDYFFLVFAIFAKLDYLTLNWSEIKNNIWTLGWWVLRHYHPYDYFTLMFCIVSRMLVLWHIIHNFFLEGLFRLVPILGNIFHTTVTHLYPPHPALRTCAALWDGSFPPCPSWCVFVFMNWLLCSEDVITFVATLLYLDGLVTELCENLFVSLNC